MNYRTLGKTGWKIGEIGFGAWAIGGSWGDVSDTDAVTALHEALDAGVNFIDTADVYGDGRSEKLIAQVLRERRKKGSSAKSEVYVATKAGRRLQPHLSEGYNAANLTGFVERSLKNLGVETLDLLQLHCPPTPVYYRPEVFEALDDLARQGKIRHYGVSVEKVEEGIVALEYPGVASVQIIFNIFRQRPSELFFQLARQRNVGIIARIPLASGLLSGKMSAQTAFDASDHRSFNRHGEQFDVGETFSGVEYELGLQAVERLRRLVPEGCTMAQFALRWILAFGDVSCTIPGARNAGQARQNTSVTILPPLGEEVMKQVKEIYNDLVRPSVHHRW